MKCAGCLPVLCVMVGVLLSEKDVIGTHLWFSPRLPNELGDADKCDHDRPALSSAPPHPMINSQFSRCMFELLCHAFPNIFKTDIALDKNNPFLN